MTALRFHRAGFGLLALAATATSAEPRAPRIVSINPCTDAVLMHVADPLQIAAISRDSHDPLATSIPLAQAQRFDFTSGSAEEIVALAPDIVIAGSHVAPATIAALKRMATGPLASPAKLHGRRWRIDAYGKGRSPNGQRRIGRLRFSTPHHIGQYYR